MALGNGCKALLGLYNILWPLALPALYLAPRLREGFAQRMLRQGPGDYVDIWIQAASGGEAYLAAELVKALPGDKPLSVLATTHTRQGLDVLDAVAHEIEKSHPNITLQRTYCPFDAPSLMNKAMVRFSPKVLVLLETEIWPGLLAAAKDNDVPTVLVNGRMNAKSLAGYLCAGGLLRQIGPSRILAISDDAAQRFRLVFGLHRVGRMQNIKFDRFPATVTPAPKDSPVRAILDSNTPCALFASVRQEEEPQILQALLALHEKRPRTTLALFPRHMHRLDFWRKALYESGLPPVLRSQLDAPPPAGSIILWDAFGELGAAYEFCRAAFVGGSLKPLGGQNFLEPLSHGIVPVTGPHWSNFAWIGREIVDLGLVHEVHDATQLVQRLEANLARPRKRDSVRAKAMAYIDRRRGGTAQAVSTIASYL